MRNKYLVQFTATDGSKFTLTFVIQGGRIIHLVDNVEVYQHSCDMFCDVMGIGSHPVTQYAAQAQMSPYRFAISINPTPEGANVYIAETNVTLDRLQTKLQPCN